MTLATTAAEATIYGYATVDLYRILHDFALDSSSPEYKGPLNAFAHSRRLADPADRAIVAMNVDTPYSYAWLDLRAEPVVLTIAPFEAERYVSAMIVDLYTYIAGYVSPRTNGHAGGDFLVAGPGWDGPVPTGIRGVFEIPTDLALVLLRTQLFEDADMVNVAAIQDACGVRPLSAYLGNPAPAAAPSLLPIAPVDVRRTPSLRFFDVLAWMLRFMPPLPEDVLIRDGLARLGVRADGTFEPDPAEAQGALAGMGEGLAAMAAHARTIRSSAEIFGSREFFGGNHLARACGAMLGILGNAAAEYLGVGWQADADGERFTGEHAYTIRFEPGGFPPVGAFWSITLYDAAQHLYANELDRYVINSRSVPRLAPDAAGGYTLSVQHARPTADRVANWLPCPSGPFGLTFRTYLPGEAIRAGDWTAPPVRKVGPAEETPR
jgi:hypothetical protein